MSAPFLFHLPPNNNLTRFPDRDWEPLWEAKYNLLLGYPLFVCRAKAQDLKLNIYDYALLWLGLSEAEQIAEVTLNGRVPFPFPSSVYIPYLEEYALLTAQGITPTPPVDSTMYGIINLADSAFGMVADYVSKDNRGSLTNSSAINAGVTLAKAQGGGTLMIPAGSYYVTPGALVNWHNIYIYGIGRGVTKLYFDPTYAGAEPFLRFQMDDLSTLYNTGFRNLSLLPITGLAENERHKKIGIQTVNVSGFDVDIQVGGEEYWRTGDDLYATEGDSIVWLSQGREKARAHNPFWHADRMCNLDINPFIPGGGPIDSDLFTFIDCDFNMPIAKDRTAVKVTDKAHLLRLKFAGQSFCAGGRNFFQWIDTPGGAATIDSPEIVFEDITGEQMTGAGWMIEINRQNTGKVSNLFINRINCNTETGGVHLGGVDRGEISGLKYSRYGDQAGSQKAIKLENTNGLIRLNGVDIPYLSDDNVMLLDATTMTKIQVMHTEDAAVGYSQVPSSVVYRHTV